MINYVKTAKYVVNGSTGFITHEDQEVNGLSFNILFRYEGEDYVKVEGEEAAIEEWKMRVEGTYVLESDVLTIQELLVS